MQNGNENISKAVSYSFRKSRLTILEEESKQKSFVQLNAESFFFTMQEDFTPQTT